MEALLGAQFFTQEGVGDIAAVLDGKKVVLFYFAAEWCQRFKNFTILLARAYAAFAEDDVDVVFVSNDQHVESFKTHYGMMPWIAVPFSRRDIKIAVSEEFFVGGIPRLVVCRPDSSVFCDNGQEAVIAHQDLRKAMVEWGAKLDSPGIIAMPPKTVLPLMMSPFLVWLRMVHRI